MTLRPAARSRHPLVPGIGLDAVVEWRGGRVVRIGLEASRGESSWPQEAGEFQRWIDGWNAGRPEQFAPDLLAWDILPARTAEILRTLVGVPFGSALTYGELAAMCGIPRGAQAVGQAMARNPFPLVVPCHRVLPRSGGVGEYSGGGSEVKRLLLAHEGVIR